MNITKEEIEMLLMEQETNVILRINKLIDVLKQHKELIWDLSKRVHKLEEKNQ